MSVRTISNASWQMSVEFLAKVCKEEKVNGLAIRDAGMELLVKGIFLHDFFDFASLCIMPHQPVIKTSLGLRDEYSSIYPG
jgi:hypothetical protein